MKRNQVIGAVIILVVVAGGSFYAGKSMASAAPARGQFGAGFAAGTGGANGTAGFAGRGAAGTRGGAAGGFTSGTIISSANGSISIQQQNGSSTEIVLLSPTTMILKQTSGTAADLTTGTSVTVTGTANSDGSMTATSVQIRPARTN
jgi:hypothetical protein